jgi:hypothetical protein
MPVELVGTVSERPLRELYDIVNGSESLTGFLSEWYNSDRVVCTEKEAAVLHSAATWSILPGQIASVVRRNLEQLRAGMATEAEVEEWIERKVLHPFCTLISDTGFALDQLPIMGTTRTERFPENRDATTTTCSQNNPVVREVLAQTATIPPLCRK